MTSSAQSIEDLMGQYKGRVQAIANMLTEAPYFYREDNEELFLFLRRHRDEFRLFFERYFGWMLIMDMKCARVYKERWYNEALGKRSRLEFGFSRRDECIAFMLLLRFFEHQLEEQSLTVESRLAPRFRFGDLLDYTRAGFLELEYDADKYTLEHVRANILRSMMPVLEQYRFLRRIAPEAGMRIQADDTIYEALPALFHYNAGMLRRPVEADRADQPSAPTPSLAATGDQP